MFRKSFNLHGLGALAVCFVAVTAAPASAGSRSDDSFCDAATDPLVLSEYPHLTADRTECEKGYFSFRLEGGPYSAVSLSFMHELYLKNIVNVYAEFGLGFGSPARDRSIDWVPAPMGRAYVGYPLSWTRHRLDKRWVVSESSDGTTITTNYFRVDVPSHRRFIPEVGIEYGRPWDLEGTLRFEDRLVLAPSVGFRWVRTHRLALEVTDADTGTRWHGSVNNRAWIAAHVIPVNLAGSSDRVGFDVEFGIPNNMGRLNQSINMTLAGGMMPNGAIFARWGFEGMLKRY